MAHDLLIGLATATIAFLSGWGARSSWYHLKRLIADHRTAQTRHRRHPRYTAPWLAAYYLRHDRLKDLFMIECRNRRKMVPFLTKEEWKCDGRAEEELLVQEIPQRRSNVPLNRTILRRRRRYLHGVDRDAEWNDLIACVMGLVDTPAGPAVKLGLAEYFQFLSACGALEDETYAAVSSPKRGTIIRDRALSSADDAAQCRLGAPALGMQVAFVFEDADRYKILIQRRSQAVSIYGGALAVVPVFGCQTTDLSEHSKISLFHNFLREVYEELYGGTEVERRGQRVDPRWFYREPPIARLVSAHSAGKLEFRLLGFGFDALNGEMDLCGLAAVKDQDFADEEVPRMLANWEIQDIQVWDLYGDRLSDAILDGDFSPGSVYTLARAREVLHSNRSA